MRFARVLYNNTAYYAIAHENSFQLINGDPYSNYTHTDIAVSDTDIVLLPPVTPSKIIAIGLNYHEHARELDMPIPEEPVIFFKPPSALIGARADIIYPAQSRHVDYEAELAFIISKKCHMITENNAPDYILGYTNLNDVTARDLQKKDSQWARAKSFDTFCPVGPVIVTPDEVGNPHDLRITTQLNGILQQNASTSDLIFNCYFILAYLSHIMTLYPGDIITTGTPSGIGPMQPGDTVAVAVENLGVLHNAVKGEP